MKTSKNRRLARLGAVLLSGGMLFVGIQFGAMFLALYSLGSADPVRRAENPAGDAEATPDSWTWKRTTLTEAFAGPAAVLPGVGAAGPSGEQRHGTAGAPRPEDGARAASTAAIPFDSRKGELRHPESYPLSISGRVLDPAGAPVPGIEVSAGPYGSREGFEAPAAELESARKGRSEEDGSYEIRGLVEGEYVVSTAATKRHPSVTAIVRAGVDAADLVLVAQRELRVRGTVTSPRGDPLAGVRVASRAGGSRDPHRCSGKLRNSLARLASRQGAEVRFSPAGLSEGTAQLRRWMVRGTAGDPARRPAGARRRGRSGFGYSEDRRGASPSGPEHPRELAASKDRVRRNQRSLRRIFDSRCRHRLGLSSIRSPQGPVSGLPAEAAGGDPGRGSLSMSSWSGWPKVA